MTFVNTTLPDDAAKGTTGGPRYNTRIVSTASGYEDRVPKWTQARHEYNINFDSIPQSAMYEVLELFHAMQGNAYSFRMKDFQDYNSVTPLQDISATDQVIGNGDSTTAAYQLVKNYTDGLTYQRAITKPKAGVLAAIGGVESTTNFSVDLSTGIITFDSISGAVASATAVAGGKTQISRSGHGLILGDSVYLSLFTGDWAALNNIRFEVIQVIDANSFIILFDSSGFATYSSNGGIINTLPQTGEQVTAGFEFDVHVRFNIGDELLDISWENLRNQSISIPLIEVRG